jgi:ribonucleoside-diphosphate reductase alpha chain
MTVAAPMYEHFNWIPDLFMRRVMEGTWTLFSASERHQMHDKFGREFEVLRMKPRQRVANSSRPARCKPLTWRKMLSMLFETGIRWSVFKDVCNPLTQQHVGVAL